MQSTGDFQKTMKDENVHHSQCMPQLPPPPHWAPSGHAHLSQQMKSPEGTSGWVGSISEPIYISHHWG